MSVFILLNAVKRNDLDYVGQILVDVNKIIVPVIENVSNNSIIEVDTDTSYSSPQFNGWEKYEVTEDLDAINALSSELFKGNIISQNGRDALVPAALFIKSRVVGTVRAINAGEDSIFDYQIMAQSSPETYVVDENLATINL